MNPPTEHAKHQVEHEEAVDDDEGDEEDPVEGVSEGVIGLGILWLLRVYKLKVEHGGLIENQKKLARACCSFRHNSIS